MLQYEVNVRNNLSEKSLNFFTDNKFFVERRCKWVARNILKEGLGMKFLHNYSTL